MFQSNLAAGERQEGALHSAVTAFDLVRNLEIAAWGVRGGRTHSRGLDAGRVSLSTQHRHEEAKWRRTKRSSKNRHGRASLDSAAIASPEFQTHKRRLPQSGKTCAELLAFARQVFIGVGVLRRRRQQGGDSPCIIRLSKKQEGDQEISQSRRAHEYFGNSYTI